MKAFFKVLGWVEDVLCIITTTIMLSLAFSNVVGRYVLGASISFTEEIVCAFFVLMCMIGTCLAIKHRSHLGLSAVTDLLPQKAQKIISVLGSLIGVGLSIGLVIWGYGLVQNQIRLQSVSMTLQWPQWIYSMALPVGAVLMVIRFLEVAYCTLFDKEVI